VPNNSKKKKEKFNNQNRFLRVSQDTDRLLGPEIGNAARQKAEETRGYEIGRNPSYLYPLRLYHPGHYKFGPEPIELYSHRYYNPCYLFDPIAKHYVINRDCFYDKNRGRYYPNY